MKYTFAIHTLGCKVNTYESDAISQSLKERGFEEVNFSERADIAPVTPLCVRFTG